MHYIYVYVMIVNDSDAMICYGINLFFFTFLRNRLEKGQSLKPYVARNATIFKNDHKGDRAFGSFPTRPPKPSSSSISLLL